MTGPFMFRDFYHIRRGPESWPKFSIFLVSLVAISLVTLILSTFAEMAFGHAFVLDSNPSPSQLLENPPKRVEVFVSEPVDDRYSKITVIGPDGKQVDEKDTKHIGGDQSTLGVTISRGGLKDGVYTVSTKMLSQIDGHVTDNAFVFGVGAETSISTSAASGQANQPSGASSPLTQLSVPDAIARYPALAGQVIVLGAAFSSIWIWSPFAKVKWLGAPSSESGHQKKTKSNRLPFDFAQMKRSVDVRLVKLMLVGALMVVIADFGMIYALAYSLNIGIIDAMTTKFGNIWFVRTTVSFLMLAVILFVQVKITRRTKVEREGNDFSGRIIGNPITSSRSISDSELVTIMVVSIFALLTTSLMGHGAAISSGAQIAIAIDFIHNVSASIWIGGIFYLAFVVVPKLKDNKSLNGRVKNCILAIIIPRFSTLPVVVLGVIVITGPFLLYFLEDNLNLTLASLYGKALLVKLILAAVMVMLGGYNQKVVHRSSLHAVTETSVGGYMQQQVVLSRSKTNEKLSSSSSLPTIPPEDANSKGRDEGMSESTIIRILKSVKQKIISLPRNQTRLSFDSSEKKNIDGIKQNRDSGSSNDPSGKDPKPSWLIPISRFNRSIKIEAALGILLLGAVAVLTNTGLPASEFQGQFQQQDEHGKNTAVQNLINSTTGINNGLAEGGGASTGGFSSTQYLENGTKRIKIAVQPLAVGNNNFKIEFLDSAGNPIDIPAVEMKMTQTEQDIGPISIQAQKVSKGVFSADAAFGLAGQWDLFIEGVTNKSATPNLAADFNIFVKPDLDQIEYSVTQIALPSNRSQPLYPVYDGSRDAIWVGDTAIGSGRIFEYDITDNQFHEHRINGSNIITTMSMDQSNGKIWFIDPIAKALGLYDPDSNTSRLYKFPNDRIIPSSIAVQSDSVATLPVFGETDYNGGTRDINTSDQNENKTSTETIWITSPSTNEVLMFDTLAGNFKSFSLPTANSSPLGVATDPYTGQIWVAEGIGKIASIDPHNNFTISEFSPTASDSQENDTLLSPTSLLISPYTGEIYISEHDGHVVSVFNPFFKTFYDLPKLSPDSLPFGMTFDKDRNLWVAEHVTNKVAVIDPVNGKHKEVTIPSPTPFIQYLTTDNDGRVWFAEQRGDALGYITSSVNFMQNPSPSISTASGSQGQEQAAENRNIRSSAANQTTIFSPLFNLGYEYVMAPIIAAGVVASAAFYTNSVVSLKATIRQVNTLSVDNNIFKTKRRTDENRKNKS
jgi:putative copper export protein/streptogramin lyase/methionine-rich copper-binding protein CopC